MRNTDIILDIHRDRGARGLPLERVYRHLLDPELFLRAYGKIYRNAGAMTKGATKETVDGMDLQKIHGIIALLRDGMYQWTPVRRTEILKADGIKKRPLGIPCWSDKLLEEVLRRLLEPYYEQRFSKYSFGFRPHLGCQRCLLEIVKRWKGTVWFIEGDIKGCFDNIDHEILLKIIRRDIHDDRLLKLIDGMLRAGYMEQWRYCDTTSGTPQGGILSPLLANVYLNELDCFVEDTLIPQYTHGEARRHSAEYNRICCLLGEAWRNEDRAEARRLLAERRKLPRSEPCDTDYRRLRYVRYADDFLLGFVGPASEARQIRDQIGEFLRDNLKLTLSVEKTLITHAVDDRAHFLGYEIGVIRQGSLVAGDGLLTTSGKTSEGESRVRASKRRTRNGCIMLKMPRKVVSKYLKRFSKKGKIIHRKEITNESDYTIVQRFQSILAGLYNYYCMASNVAGRMSRIQWILQTSLRKTLASKHRCKASKIDRKYRVTVQGYTAYRVEITRPGKAPLVATFGGMSFRKNPEGLGMEGFDPQLAWSMPAGPRSEAVMHLLYGKCALCGAEGVQMHHIRKLADINRPGRRPKEPWEKIMAARKRKFLPVCRACHDDIHAGRYDGPRLRQ
jgi:group II intron reverse transcriptase/maturase